MGLRLYPITSRLGKSSYWCGVAGGSFVLHLCLICSNNVCTWAVELKCISKSSLHLPGVWTVEIFVTSSTHSWWRSKGLKKSIRWGPSKIGAEAPWWGCVLLGRSQQCLPSCACFGNEKVNTASYTVMLLTLSSSWLYPYGTLFSCVFQVVYQCSASGEWVNEEMGTKPPKCVPGTTKNCVYVHATYEDHCSFHLPVFKLLSLKVQLILSMLFESHWTGYFWKLWAPKKGQMRQQKETGNKSGRHNKTSGITGPFQASVCVSAPVSPPSSVPILKSFSALNLCLHCR